MYTTQDIKGRLRAGEYAWPGGYQLYFLASDGEALSFKAVRENLKQVLRSTYYRLHDGWTIDACEINWEDPALYCAHTGERIESAYGTDSEYGNLCEQVEA